VEASALSAPAGLGRGSVPSPWLRLRSDEQLLGLFRSGSEEAFAVIHDRYRQRLLAYARQMLAGSGPDAEDVLQDVFLRAYRALRVDERPVSLRAWLYRVAHNRCIDSLRRPTPDACEIFEMSRMPVLDTTVQAERREDLQRLVEDVRRLPDQQRSALLMREMDGMSYLDLAEALDTSVPAIKSLLVRARIGLVEAIEARDTDCADIRHDLAASYDRGVRASGRSRRHLRDCDGCDRYRTQLRAVRQGFAALSPVAPIGILAKLLGLGGASAGSGAAAGGAAAGSGTTAATIGGGAAAAASVTKVAVVVCCAAAITGGAVEVQKIASPSSHGRRATTHRAVLGTAPASAPALAGRSRSGGAVARPGARPGAGAAGASGHAPAPALRNPNGAGGAIAPADTSTPVPSGDAPSGGGTPATDPSSSTGANGSVLGALGGDSSSSASSGSGSGSSSTSPSDGSPSASSSGWGSPSSDDTSASSSSSSSSSSSTPSGGASSPSSGSGGPGPTPHPSF
jgi:RNA polymerase sigma factor (sigma-70 family)